RTYNSNTRVRVSRSDDTDLDGTAQVPGQSPELTAWLTKNLGHPTGEVRRHRPRRYSTSTGTKPRANSLAHKEPGAPNWREVGGHIDCRLQGVNGKGTGR
ncbi:hypothetical protein Taro_006399, partial [Colocasia esculenta]|nr:hypothetical protein [Colocasia esculenta]